MTRQLQNLTVEIADLLLDGLARREKRPDHSHQLGTILDQSIEDKIPDHSTFSRARQERFRECDAFRRVSSASLKPALPQGWLAVKASRLMRA